MKLGPLIIYTCPHCSGLLCKSSFSSYNNFMSRLYSDGKTVGPMYPDHYWASRCSHCNNYFVLSKAKSKYDLKEESLDLPYLSKLTLEECYDALAKGGFTLEDEKVIRLECWRQGNDPERNQTEYIRNEEERTKWEKNMMAFIKLVDENNDDEKIFRIEMLRRMEFFDEALERLEKENSLDEKMKDKFRKACEEKNSSLIRLSEL